MLKLLFLVFVVSDAYLVHAQINMTEYFRMPPIFKLDDYDRCFQTAEPHKEVRYCFTRSLIKPNDSSVIWNIIEKYSSDTKRFYRHDRLNRGICIPWCRRFMEHFDYDTRVQYNLEHFASEKDIRRDVDIHRNESYDKLKYRELVTQCVNYELWHNYSLKAQTDVVYCITNTDDVQMTLDSWDLAFVIVLVIIAVLIVMSTSYDFHLKRNNLPHLSNREHYKRPVDENGLSSLLVSFSIPRNWYKLISDSSGELSRDLRAINAMRTFCMFGVICAHAALANNISPQKNTYYMEEKFFHIGNMILINGANVLQAFFSITGFLLAIQFMDLREKNKYKAAYFWQAVLYRYLRFTPTYLFIVLFNATLFFKLGHGPAWPLLAENERTSCRNNWWTNMLYVNNFIRTKEPCMQHAWYLAADFQLTIMGTIIQMIIWRYTKLTKPLYSIVMVISFVVPAVITYIYRFDGTFMAAPECTRYSHLFDDMYTTIYIPWYTNTGSFVLGMIGGLIWCKHKQGHIDLSKSKILPVAWYSLIPVAFIGLLSGYVFYTYNFEKPAIWIAVYAAVMKNLWGFFGAILVIGAALNTGWVFKNLLRMPFFRIMGRLTFGAYLIHPMILRISFGTVHDPIYSSNILLWNVSLSTFITSYSLSAVMCLAVEMPFSVIQRRLFQRESMATNKTIYDTREPETIKLSKTIAVAAEARINKSFS